MTALLILRFLIGFILMHKFFCKISDHFSMSFARCFDRDRYNSGFFFAAAHGPHSVSGGHVLPPELCAPLAIGSLVGICGWLRAGIVGGVVDANGNGDHVAVAHVAGAGEECFCGAEPNGGGACHVFSPIYINNISGRNMLHKDEMR